MQKDIPLKIEILSSDKDEQYRITSPREIEFVLQSIVKSGSRIALYYSNTNEFILTHLLAVDASGLWLEQRPDSDENTPVLTSDRLIFVSSHAQVKVQFVADGAVSATYKKMPAFFIELPESIYRLQRREYYRLITPVSNPLLCIIPGEQAVARQGHEVTIMDISGGGVGLTCAEQNLELIPGKTYENCKIDLHDIGEFIGTIEVKNLAVLSLPSGQTVRRAGCEFKNLDGTSTIMLQRYVTAMQRARGKD
jgi:c-di-GMP-binding flagellar brake protein YcgR